ncbi:MAG: oligoribonuclease [Chlamydiales bacterium]|jgi:oligoribonuclease
MTASVNQASAIESKATMDVDTPSIGRDAQKRKYSEITQDAGDQEVHLLKRRRGDPRIGIFLDSETNGLNPQTNRMLEIAFRLVDTYSGLVLESFNSMIRVSEEDWKNSHPRALEVNGITKEQMEKGSPIDEVANKIKALFQRHHVDRWNSCYICQNPSFDRSFFQQLFTEDEQFKNGWPYHWLDLASMNFGMTMHDYTTGVKTKYEEVPFSKDGIARQHGLPPENKMHEAMGGVDHLLDIYEHLVGFPGKVGASGAVGSSSSSVILADPLPMTVREPFFSQIKNGTKTVEGRLSRGSYRNLQVGMNLRFNDEVTCRVTGIQKYASFREMIEAEGIDNVLPGLTETSEAEEIYHHFYSPEDVTLYGALAIQIERV